MSKEQYSNIIVQSNKTYSLYIFSFNIKMTYIYIPQQS